MIPIEPPFAVERAITAVLLSWLLSQLTKVFRGMRQEKRFNFRWIFDTGGMPSSHSATVASLATVVGLYYGFKTIPFLMACIYSIIIMFDAAGVRRSVGRQAAILNKMMEDVNKGREVPETRMKELLGHTPIEVFAGALVGIVLALIFCGL